MKRFFASLGIILVLLLPMAAGWLYISPPYSWIGGRLVAMARAQGIPLRALQVRHVTLHGIDLADVELDTEPPLTVPQVTVQYDRALFTDQIVRDVQISGLKLTAQWKDGTLSAPWLKALSGPAHPQAEKSGLTFIEETHLSVLPFQRLMITDSRLALEGDATATLPITILMERDTQTMLRLSTDDASAAIGDVSALLTQGMIEARWHKGGYWVTEANLQNLALTYGAQSRLVNVTAASRWDAEQLTVDGSLDDVAQQLALRARYMLRNVDYSQTYDAELAPVRFVAGKFQPADLYPPLGDRLQGVSGSAGLRASGTRQEGRWRHEAELNLIDLDLLAHAVPVKGINGTVHLEGEPWRTRGVETVTISSVGIAQPLEKGTVRFRLKSDGTLLIPSTEWSWLGGSVRTREMAFMLGAEPELDTTVEVAGLPLDRLLQLTEQGAIEATGTLNGRLPLRYEEGKLSILQGELTASDGHLRYADAAQAIPGDGAQAELVRTALQNLEYTTLKLDIASIGGEEEHAVLYVEGANPDLMGGKPVKLTVNLTGDLTETIRQSFNAYTAPEKLIHSRPDEPDETDVP